VWPNASRSAGVAAGTRRLQPCARPDRQCADRRFRPSVRIGQETARTPCPRPAARLFDAGTGQSSTDRRGLSEAFVVQPGDLVSTAGTLRNPGGTRGMGHPGIAEISLRAVVLARGGTGVWTVDRARDVGGPGSW